MIRARIEGDRALFYCVACKMVHGISFGDGPGPRWGFNGSAERPTFTPSVLARFNWKDKPVVCHSYVTDGHIDYLGDCTHEYAGKKIELPEFRWGEDDPDDDPQED